MAEELAHARRCHGRSLASQLPPEGGLADFALRDLAPDSLKLAPQLWAHLQVPTDSYVTFDLLLVASYFLLRSFRGSMNATLWTKMR